MYKFLLMLALSFMVSSCGWFENVYESLNYESLTNEEGVVNVYSGGILIRKYPEAKIIYSTSDSQGMLIEYNGKRIFIQGDAIVDLKD